MLENHGDAIIACRKLGEKYVASNNVEGDIMKTYAPTAELAIEAMKQHLDGEE